MSLTSTSDQMVVTFSDGGSFLVNTRSPSAYLLHPVFLQFVVLATLVFALLVRPEIPGLDTTAQIALVWCVVFLACLICLGLSAWLSRWLIDIGALNAIYTPMILLPLAFTTHFVFYASSYFLEPVHLSSFAPSFEMVAKYFLALICFDLLHGHYVAPLHPLTTTDETPKKAYRRTVDDDNTVISIPSLPPVSETSQNSTARFRSSQYATPEVVEPDAGELSGQGGSPAIEIGGGLYDPRKIQVIRSEEHYLSIQSIDGTELIRAKLADATAMLPAALGYQINRSIWVAYSEIIAYEKVSGRVELELHTGEILRVARSRSKDFLQTYDQQQRKSA